MRSAVLGLGGAALVLQAVLLQVPLALAGSVYLYEWSCNSLVPQHYLDTSGTGSGSSGDPTTNSVSNTGTDTTGTGTTTTETPTTTTTNAPTTTTTDTTTTTETTDGTITTIQPLTAFPPFTVMTSSNVDFKVTILDFRYRRYGVLTVELSSDTFFQGFTVQAFNEAGQVVGVFTTAAPTSQALITTCFDGKMDTVTDRKRPIQMTRIVLGWTPPDNETTQIQFRASFLRNGQYAIVNSTEVKFNPFPPDMTNCGKSISCYRYCMQNGGNTCRPQDARFIFMLAANDTAKEATFTLGGPVENNGNTTGYLAVGITKDADMMPNMDVAICYMDPITSVVKIEHYELLEKGYDLDAHMGVLTLSDFDVDDDYIWCQYKRTLTDSTQSFANAIDIDLEEEKDFVFFWGVREDNGEIEMAHPSQMHIVRDYSTSDNEEFNDSNRKESSASRAVLSLAIVTLCCISFLW